MTKGFNVNTDIEQFIPGNLLDVPEKPLNYDTRQRHRKLPSIQEVLMALFRSYFERHNEPPPEFQLTQRQFQILNNELKDSFSAESNPTTDTRPPPSFNGVPITIISEQQAVISQNRIAFGQARKLTDEV